jgi:hypothetical protein
MFHPLLSKCFYVLSTYISDHFNNKSKPEYCNEKESRTQALARTENMLNTRLTDFEKTYVSFPEFIPSF